MKRIALLLALLAVLAAVAACSPGDAGATSTSTTVAMPTTTLFQETDTTEAPDFPVTVEDDIGQVTIEQRPESIVSLTTTGTEMLFAVGAGDQVVAVDEFSTYPEEAPVTDLSGFTPNVEAILEFEPDLVVISFDPGDLQESLKQVGVPSLLLRTASSLDDSYRQLHVLGAATGHADQAEIVVAGMEDALADLFTEGTYDGVSFFHEVTEDLYTTNSASFLGQVYDSFGLTNIADGADDPDGFGFPQLSAEFVVEQDPDIIFLGDADFGVTPESLAERPGWSGMTALESGAIVSVDTYLASNWGPRVVELAELIAAALAQYAAGT